MRHFPSLSNIITAFSLEPATQSARQFPSNNINHNIFANQKYNHWCKSAECQQFWNILSSPAPWSTEFESQLRNPAPSCRHYYWRRHNQRTFATVETYWHLALRCHERQRCGAKRKYNKPDKEANKRLGNEYGDRRPNPWHAPKIRKRDNEEQLAIEP